MGIKNQIITKSLESGDLKISGYASVFNVVDLYRDIIEAGAFTETIASNKSIKLLWQHDIRDPIGRIDNLKEDSTGLYMDAVITSGTNKGREAIDLIKKNIINGLSIGFNINTYYTKPDGVRVITSINLWEISVVTFPANLSASILENHKNNKLYNILSEAENLIRLINQKVKNGRISNKSR